jgi:hypothetical protein
MISRVPTRSVLQTSCCNGWMSHRETLQTYSSQKPFDARPFVPRIVHDWITH